LPLRGVPRRGDVGVGSVEDDQRLHVGRGAFPLGVRPGQMALEGSQGRWIGLQYEPDVAGSQPVRRQRHQRPEGAGTDEIVQNLQAIFGEVLGDIHALKTSRPAMDLFAGQAYKYSPISALSSMMR